MAVIQSLSKHCNRFCETNRRNEGSDKLKTKCPTVEQNVGNLSGGNQQKVLLAKWMFANPNVLILDEPTNHLDLESITSLNKGLCNLKGEILFTSRDYELNSTVPDV